MDEVPGRSIARVSQMVRAAMRESVHEVALEVAEQVIVDHERHTHHVPAPNRKRLTAIPFADVVISDEDLAKAVEMLEARWEISDVAIALEQPLLALERHLAEFWPRWNEFVLNRTFAR
jgi:hypothetical protein